jgi:hypothetical protein
MALIQIMPSGGTLGAKQAKLRRNVRQPALNISTVPSCRLREGPFSALFLTDLDVDYGHLPAYGVS